MYAIISFPAFSLVPLQSTMNIVGNGGPVTNIKSMKEKYLMTSLVYG